MKRTLSKFALLIFSFCSLNAAHEDTSYEFESQNDQIVPVYIKALVKQNIEGALIDVRGPYKVFNPENGKQLSSGFSGKKYFLQTNPAGLKWGEGYPGVHQIKIVPTKSDTTILVDGIQYKGTLEAYDINSKIQLVNEVEIEDFLRSVLSKEFASNTCSPPVSDALAIAMRTNAYNIVAKSTNPYWDVNAEEVGYFGEGQSRINDQIEKSIFATKGLIMTFQDRPFYTTWTENCAGKTASFEAIFRKKGIGPDGVLVGYAQKERARHNWRCSISCAKLAQLLKLSKVDSVDLYQDSITKKVYAIRFADKKRIVELTVFDFQKLLGASRIQSTDFSVKIADNNVLFEGFGKGSGVGLCLLTANQMAKTGSSMPQILVEFYPSTHIVKLTKMPTTFMNKSD